MPALCVGLGMWAGAACGQESIDLECPCRLQSSESGATVTLAARSFRPDRDSGDLRVEIRAYGEHEPLAWDDAVPIAAVPLDAIAPADAMLERASYQGEFDVPSRLDADGRYKLMLDCRNGAATIGLIWITFAWPSLSPCRRRRSTSATSTTWPTRTATAWATSTNGWPAPIPTIPTPRRARWRWTCWPSTTAASPKSSTTTPTRASATS